ncbi:unnamed protein product [Symbiodinium microadriaticum]|nr:unnamed protein product [Symbiodinium microadriaticum]
MARSRPCCAGGFRSPVLYHRARGFSPTFFAASAACYLCGVGPLPFVQGSPSRGILYPTFLHSGSRLCLLDFAEVRLPEPEEWTEEHVLVCVGPWPLQDPADAEIPEPIVYPHAASLSYLAEGKELDFFGEIPPETGFVINTCGLPTSNGDSFDGCPHFEDALSALRLSCDLVRLALRLWTSGIRTCLHLPWPSGEDTSFLSQIGGIRCQRGEGRATFWDYLVEWRSTELCAVEPSHSVDAVDFDQMLQAIDSKLQAVFLKVQAIQDRFDELTAKEQEGGQKHLRLLQGIDHKWSEIEARLQAWEAQTIDAANAVPAMSLAEKQRDANLQEMAEKLKEKVELELQRARKKAEKRVHSLEEKLKEARAEAAEAKRKLKKEGEAIAAWMTPTPCLGPCSQHAGYCEQRCLRFSSAHLSSGSCLQIRA